MNQITKLRFGLGCAIQNRKALLFSYNQHVKGQQFVRSSFLGNQYGFYSYSKGWKFHVNKALKDAKRHKFYINTKSGRYIGIIDTKSKKKEKTIFALDYHKYKVNHKSTTEPVLHYHLGTNLNIHYPIYPANPKFEKQEVQVWKCSLII